MENKLNKPHIVVYNEEKNIIIKLNNNTETFPGLNCFFAEFDEEENLAKFIAENNLVENTKNTLAE
ncbi:MAG: hypothetical protein E2600_15905 [Chryseobacterium sp.]|nr:hypothetical protein [Chryseobacterium sp.]